MSSSARHFADQFVVSDRGMLAAARQAARAEATADAVLDLRGLSRLVQCDGPVPAKRAVRVVRREALALAATLAGARQAVVQNHVHSLGAALFFALTGRAPFEPMTSELLMAGLVDGPPCPSRYAPYLVPTALDAVVRTCLAMNPADRFGSVQELAAALGAIAGSEASEADQGPASMASRVAGPPSLHAVQATPSIQAMPEDENQTVRAETAVVRRRRLQPAA